MNALRWWSIIKYGDGGYIPRPANLRWGNRVRFENGESFEKMFSMIAYKKLVFWFSHSSFWSLIFDGAIARLRPQTLPHPAGNCLSLTLKEWQSEGLYTPYIDTNMHGECRLILKYIQFFTSSTSMAYIPVLKSRTDIFYRVECQVKQVGCEFML